MATQTWLASASLVVTKRIVAPIRQVSLVSIGPQSNRRLARDNLARSLPRNATIASLARFVSLSDRSTGSGGVFLRPFSQAIWSKPVFLHRRTLIAKQLSRSSAPEHHRNRPPNRLQRAIALCFDTLSLWHCSAVGGAPVTGPTNTRSVVANMAELFCPRCPYEEGIDPAL